MNSIAIPTTVIDTMLFVSKNSQGVNAELSPNSEATKLKSMAVITPNIAAVAIPVANSRYAYCRVVPDSAFIFARCHMCPNDPDSITATLLDAIIDISWRKFPANSLLSYGISFQGNSSAVTIEADMAIRVIAVTENRYVRFSIQLTGLKNCQ